MKTVSKEQTQADLSAIKRDGYVVIERFLDEAVCNAVRQGLAPHLGETLLGRNDFEGYATERVYSLVARGKVFEDLVQHPRIMAICDALLEPNYLLTASQAINIRPGETAQALHNDDAFYRIPRPRDAISVSTIYAIDPFTQENGATQIAPGSHTWSDAEVNDLLLKVDFSSRPGNSPLEAQHDETTARLAEGLIDVAMPAGSVIVFLGTLVHRGAANRSAAPRLALSNQYCQPWARPQENYILSVRSERAAAMSERVQSLLGYSIHPPFMGHANAIHPRRYLKDDSYKI